AVAAAASQQRSGRAGRGGLSGKPDPELAALTPPDPGKSAKAVEAAAVRLLAGREHSVAELQRKLLQKGHPAEAVASVVGKLQGKRLVSDERFVASFIRHHAQRGQGPVRIRAELRQQGISDEAIEEHLDSAGQDWAQLARSVRIRKFGAEPPRAMPERA